MFFVVIDAHFKRPEVITMKSITSEKYIEVLMSLFSRYGIPEQLVSDNGLQFTSQEFKEFLQMNVVKHITSAPRHPSTNGKAERFVQTLKKALNAHQCDEGTLHQKLSRFLLNYRTIPHSTIGISASELFLSRRLRTRLELLHTSIKKAVHEKQAQQRKYHNAHIKSRIFEVEKSVLARNYYGREKSCYRRVLERTGGTSYRLEMANGIVWGRHADHILKTGKMGEESEAALPLMDLPTVPKGVLSPQQEGSQKSQQILSEFGCDHGTAASHKAQQTQTALLTETTSTVTTPTTTETSATHIPPLRRFTTTRTFPNRLGWDL